MTKYQVKLTTRTETVEAAHYKIEEGGTLTFERGIPRWPWFEAFLSFSHRDWVRVGKVEENATDS